MTDTAEMIKLTERPDLVLVLHEDTTHIRIGVDSSQLKHASKVFATMLGPNFYEGQDISRDSPRDLVLPEDNASAMKIICQVLHHKCSEATCDISPSLIKEIAVLGNKYGMEVALFYPSRVWLDLRRLSAPSFQDVSDLLKASYLLGDPVSFRTLTSKLITDYAECYSSMGPLSPLEDGIEIFGRLQDPRKTMSALIHN